MLMYQKKRARNRMIAFLVLFSILFVAFNIRISQVICSVSQTQAKYMAMDIINSVVTEYLSQTGDLYQSVLSMEKNEDGSIRAVHTDIAKINQLQHNITTSILERLDQNGNTYLKVPITSLVGANILSNWGPSFPLKLVPLPNIQVTFKDNFVSAGINQTKYTLDLYVKLDMTVMVTPLQNDVSVEHVIPVAQMVLLGNVPSSYTDINGLRTYPGVSVGGD